MQRRSLFKALLATGAGVLTLPVLAKDDKHWKGKPPKGPKHHKHKHHPHYYNARGHAFGRGKRLPGEFRARHYVVTDYWHYHLPRPARHQHWVQVGPDFVLVVATTGLIVNVVLGN